MQFHFHAHQSHFHKNGFALRLALKAHGNSEMAYCNDSQNSQLKWSTCIYYEDKFVENSSTEQTFLYQTSLVIYKRKD